MKRTLMTLALLASTATAYAGTDVTCYVPKPGNDRFQQLDFENVHLVSTSGSALTFIDNTGVKVTLVNAVCIVNR